MDTPVSVSVPVLSKTKVSINPAILTLSGAIQKTSCFRSLCTANMIPQLIAAGKAGGTQITIKLPSLSRISARESPLVTITGKIAT